MKQIERQTSKCEVPFSLIGLEMQSAIFKDRVDAAKQLTKRLQWLKDEMQGGNIEPANKSSFVILSIPRGGVVIGDVIALELGAKLDVVVSRKIGDPFNTELAIGAVMPDGSYFLNEVANTINARIYRFSNRERSKRNRKTTNQFLRE